VNLRNKNLDEWLLAQKPADFPEQRDYPAQFKALADYLNSNVHPQVTAGSMVRDGGYLTDHGPKHIRTLIQRISQIVSFEACQLTPYEVFFLLVSAHFHDVGNIFGRDQHEAKSREVMKLSGLQVWLDSVERRYIRDIAQAHGGADKDKLRTWAESDKIKNQTVRVRLLAALLKFSDELAEDSERAARFSLAIGILPPESEIYHVYAKTLQSVYVDHKAHEIAFSYELTESEAKKTFPSKEGTGRLLLDYILERSLKAHCERSYCARYLRPTIYIDQISVTIKIVSDDGYDIWASFGYRLSDVGYPSIQPEGIYELCPELTNPIAITQWNDRGRVTGASIKSYLNQNSVSAEPVHGV